VSDLDRASARDARAHVHKDLGVLRRRRALSLFLISALCAGLVAGLSLLDPSPDSGARDGVWSASLVLLIASATLAASAALGIPLWDRPQLIGVIALSLIALVAGTMMIAGPAAPHGTSLKLECLTHGTGAGALMFVVLRAITGGIWRRFPDSTGIAAVGAAATSLAYLAVRCGRPDTLHLAVAHLPVLLLVYAVAKLAMALRGSEA
jgi:hypothetical protein